MEGINSRLDKAEDHISDLEEKVKKKIPKQSSKKKKEFLKIEGSLRNILDNMKHNNINVMGISEGEESEQGIGNLLEEIITENFLNLVKEKDTQVQEAQRVPKKLDPRRATPKHIINKMTRLNDKK